MVSEAVLALLRKASDTADQKEKIKAFTEAIDTAVKSNSSSAGAEGDPVGDCKGIADHVLSTEVSQWVSRDALQYFSTALKTLPQGAHEEVAMYTLELVQPRASNFEDQVRTLREQLSQLLEEKQLWSRAAEILSGINLDSNSNRTDFDDKYKLEKCLKIASLFLEDKQATKAESFVNRAAFLMSSCKEDAALQLQYKSCYARILDAKCKFLEAALRYYELSNMSAAGAGQMLAVGSEEQRETQRPSSMQESALVEAVICTILASAGPQRSRVLATLYKDERCIKLAGGVYPILQKVYMERILQPHEVAEFSKLLKPHQKATSGGPGGEKKGTTVLEHAVIEHNLQSASRLYKNISFDELGRMLGIDPERAEKTAARMVSEGRMGGSIDQVDGFIYFSQNQSQGGGGGDGAGYGDNEIVAWNQQIRNLCQDVNSIVDSMQAKGYKVEIPSSQP